MLEDFRDNIDRAHVYGYRAGADYAKKDLVKSLCHCENYERFKNKKQFSPREELLLDSMFFRGFYKATSEEYRDREYFSIERR